MMSTFFSLAILEALSMSSFEKPIYLNFAISDLFSILTVIYYVNRPKGMPYGLTDC
jgi:hypothetical protein